MPNLSQVAENETIRLMSDVDVVIEDGGGFLLS